MAQNQSHKDSLHFMPPQHSAHNFSLSDKQTPTVQTAPGSSTNKSVITRIKKATRDSTLYTKQNTHHAGLEPCGTSVLTQPMCTSKIVGERMCSRN